MFITNPPNGVLLGSCKLKTVDFNVYLNLLNVFPYSIKGDSGYVVEPWLFTPLNETTTEKDAYYNETLFKTWQIVENAIGLWKVVFRRFDLSGGTLMYKPEKVCKLIIACCILHNIRRYLRLPQDEEYNHPPINEDDQTPANMNEDAISIAGFRQLQEFINNVF